MKTVSVIDYGMGNTWSVISALSYLGARVCLNGDADKVAKEEYIVLPGVGSFSAGMEALDNRSLDDAIHFAASRGAKILGICLGMQLLGAWGEEGKGVKGLNLISNNVKKFTKEEVGDNKIPHVGFNSVEFSSDQGLFNGLGENADFYFTHSFRMNADDLHANLGLCTYGKQFLAAFEYENVCGTQFHPEKSQTNGLVLLRNFLQN